MTCAQTDPDLSPGSLSGVGCLRSTSERTDALPGLSGKKILQNESLRNIILRFKENRQRKHRQLVPAAYANSRARDGNCVTAATQAAAAAMRTP